MSEQGECRTGGCLCGAVRYRVSGAPVFVMQCYCRDCQLATGTGHTTIVGVMSDNLDISGELKAYTVTGASGGRVNRHFCGVCGSRIFTSGDLSGPLRMVQAGTLDDPGSVSPAGAVFLKDRVHWDHVDPGIQHFDAMYPIEPPREQSGRA